MSARKTVGMVGGSVGAVALAAALFMQQSPQDTRDVTAPEEEATPVEVPVTSDPPAAAADATAADDSNDNPAVDRDADHSSAGGDAGPTEGPGSGTPEVASSGRHSVAWVCREFPNRVEKLFGALDLTRDGLDSVRSAVAARDWPLACNQLLAYYQQSESGAWMRKQPVGRDTRVDARADKVVDGVANLYSVEAGIRTGDGRIDWAADGGTGDPEWTRALHRHSTLVHLFWGYQKTGNRRYVQQLDDDLVDWIVTSPYRSRRGDKPQWGGLEVCIRGRRWAEFFYELLDVAEFSPAARILMLSSLPDHAHFLRNFHRQENWTMNQMTALATIAVSWPEFARAGEWLDYAVGVMQYQFDEHVYPDGAQSELTSLYHGYITGYFDTFVSLLEQIDHPAATSMDVARMYGYMAGTMRPDGRGPRNNDSDEHNTRIPVMDAASRYGRPEWEYVATNGESGEKPAGEPSRVFPWAGQLVMRSGYQADAHWGFFDVGPWGVAHQHNDKLHISVSAFGRDLLVDPGRYSYKAGEFNRFFAGSAAHNVLLIDGYSQSGSEKKAASELPSDTWRITRNFDYARGTFDAGFIGLGRDVTHTRAVLYVRGVAWVVVDRVTTDSPRDVTALWHFHPKCTVVLDGANAVTTDAGQGNLRVAPAGSGWRAGIVSGATDPVQGWYSTYYNRKEPSPVAVYERRIQGTTDFAWVLFPARGEPAAVSAVLDGAGRDAVVVRFTAGNERYSVTVPITGGEPSVN